MSKCVECHGAHGEGGTKHKEPLAGTRSLAQLTDYIGKSMPEEDPGTLSKSDAEAVAAFVYNTFYSAIAQQRNAPARIELARITVKQYRNAMTDLIGSFRGGPEQRSEHGLKAEYFDGRHFDDMRRVLERVDPQVDFDFAEESPIPGKIGPKEFAIRWRGSVRAEETGDYEFILRTDHAGRLWLNDDRHALIDAWVKSGDDTEHRATAYLIAGRAYPLRLEFAKATQGVEKKKGKPVDPPKPPPKARIALWWKRPTGIAEAIPARNLSPAWSPEAFVCATPFPPDDRSYGWERGASVSKEWDNATTDAALETAEYIEHNLQSLSGAPDDAGNRQERLKEFCHKFAERAVRRPLWPEQTRVLIDKQFAAAKDPETAVRRVVLATLKSPWFLYRELSGGADGYDVAARLSFGLWDSLPDQQLLSAAAGKQLSKPEQVAAQAERMIADPRAKTKLRQFLLTWVKADQAGELSKDGGKFPGFDAAVAADLRTSLELFFDDVLESDGADFRQLLLADYTLMNGRLAKFYNVDLKPDADFTKVKFDADQRAGVLTHPFLMSNFAHYKESSPILRGVFLARGVLSLSLRPPPEAIAPLAPELQPNLTTRERVAMQTKAETCMMCHGIINPLGFTLEHFDAVGRYRGEDNGKAVDDSGSYLTRSGKRVTVHGAHELAEFLVHSDEAQSAFVEQLFHYLVQQPVQAYGPNTLEELRKSFAAKQYNIRKLAVEIMAASALKPRNAP